jgi:hypothetical protein
MDRHRTSTKNTLFKKVIIQGPAWLLAPGFQARINAQDGACDQFLVLLNANDLTAARNKTEQELQEAILELIKDAPYGKLHHALTT